MQVSEIFTSSPRLALAYVHARTVRQLQMSVRHHDVVILDVLCHTHCYGRPAGAWAFDAIAKQCANRSDIWVTTRGKIADHFLASF